MDVIVDALDIRAKNIFRNFVRLQKTSSCVKKIFKETRSLKFAKFVIIQIIMIAIRNENFTILVSDPRNTMKFGQVSSMGRG